MSEQAPVRPPRDDLYRAIRPGLELRKADDDGAMPTMVGHFAVFNRWTEIDSVFEGHFIERIAPGAFKKTFRENGSAIRALFQHGMDPQIGDKVLGMPEVLREDETGAYYEVPLLDTTYNRDILPGLQAGAYGASFRFRVMKEAFNNTPERSDVNPDGLPERTIQEAQVMEFGPVTFPAYDGASAGVRSLTREMYRLRLDAEDGQHDGEALSRDGADEGHSDEQSREDTPQPEPARHVAGRDCLHCRQIVERSRRKQ